MFLYCPDACWLLKRERTIDLYLYEISDFDVLILVPWGLLIASTGPSLRRYTSRLTELCKCDRLLKLCDQIPRATLAKPPIPNKVRFQRGV